MAKTVGLAHGPDADDAFLFCALAKGRVDTKGLKFRFDLQDIETLNLRATEGMHEVTALSFAAYPAVRDRYRLMNCGARVGDGRGPIVVSKRSLTREDLDEVTIAVPGERTTAFLVLRLFSPGIRHRVVPPGRVLDLVADGEVDAGLAVHEEQVTYADRKLRRIVDLGEWWKMETSLPLPLSANAVRRDIESATAWTIAEVMRAAFEHAVAHRAEALKHALTFARGLDRKKAERFVGLYLNNYTVDLGAEGRRAVEKLLYLGQEAGLLPEADPPDFIG
ncbi:MAG: menaquinone biosynthesis family protein [Planctomycetota bacterium]